MKWSDIDFDAGIWTVSGNEAKSKKEMRIVLSLESIKFLKEMVEISGNEIFVFPANSKSGHMQEPKKEWRKLCRDAGLQDCHMHDLRATFATQQKNLGSPISTISNSLCHSNTNTTGIYLRDNSQDFDAVKASVNLLCNNFRTIYENAKKELEKA